METNTYSITPSRDVVDLFERYDTIVIFLKAPWRLRFNIFSFIIKLIVAPRLISVLGTKIFLICTSIIGLLGSRYFREIILPSIRSNSCPKKFIVRESLFLLPGLLKHYSLVSLLYMGTHLIALRGATLIHMCFNSLRILASFGVCYLGWTNFSR